MRSFQNSTYIYFLSKSIQYSSLCLTAFSELCPSELKLLLYLIPPMDYLQAESLFSVNMDLSIIFTHLCWSRFVSKGLKYHDVSAQI
ncbi:hypothetical protein P3L10_026650 [Capsicum annuum]